MSIFLLWLCATPIFSNFLLETLENKYPPKNIENLLNVDAIVILGGGVVENKNITNFFGLHTSLIRLLHGMELYKMHKAPKIILTGGGLAGELPEAEVMLKFLQKFNIDEDDILLETKSHNTYENAVNIRNIIQQYGIKKIILVTSAFHMPRALATFKTLDINTIPSPTDYNVDYSKYGILNWMPDAFSLHKTTISCKEYLGWWFYKARGWIHS